VVWMLSLFPVMRGKAFLDLYEPYNLWSCLRSTHLTSLDFPLRGQLEIALILRALNASRFTEAKTSRVAITLAIKALRGFVWGGN